MYTHIYESHPVRCQVWSLKPQLYFKKKNQKTKHHLLCHFHSMKSTSCLKLKHAHRKLCARCGSYMKTSGGFACTCGPWNAAKIRFGLVLSPYGRFRAVLHSCDSKFQPPVANVYLQCYSRFLSHAFWLWVCVCLNEILGADTQLRKARKQTCKDTQWNVRGLAGMFTIKNKLYHIMTGKVN